jgi:hypothetical protein
LFRCESAVLQTHWVLVVMDHCTRRIVGFGVHRGVGLCRMFNRATRGQTPPTYVSSDHDPLYRFTNGHRTHAGLGGRTPNSSSGPSRVGANVRSYRWQVHCRGLYHTLIAA